ncbi:uncharacterized protein [Amphiura filiformis]|uniref:uncharacterized protein n=1 Tax=Amphiura filiformis TaxID=82378 RepID=UPI003B21A480
MEEYQKAKRAIKEGKSYGQNGIPPEEIMESNIDGTDSEAKAMTQDGDTDEFETLAGVLQGDTLAPYLFFIVIEYCLRIAIDGRDERLGFTMKSRKSPRFKHPYPYISPYTVGLRAFANIISTFVSDKKCQMIDIAAGSGLLGFEMKKLGFENIDGLEPVEDMIKMQPSGIYGKLYRELISKEKTTSIPTGYYDCVVSGAGIYAGHIEVDALPEIIRIVKPGGLITFNIGDHWYRFKQFGPALETKLQQCLETGVLETVIKQRTIYMYNCDDANVYILKKSSNKIISEV